MPLYYKGAGPGTYWHVNDARVTGFTAVVPAMPPTRPRMIQHISNSSTISPYISLSKSYGIAWDYAVYCGRRAPKATAVDPGFVYEIELADPLPPGVIDIHDALKELAQGCSGPLIAPSYMHDGASRFVLGVLDPLRLNHLRHVMALQVPPGGGIPRPPNLTDDLLAMLRAIRDAEILVQGHIPANCVLQRIDVH